MVSMGGFPGQSHGGAVRATPWAAHLYVQELIGHIAGALEDDHPAQDVLDDVVARLENLYADLTDAPRPNFGATRIRTYRPPARD